MSPKLLRPTVLILIGVSGSGKTTIGRLVAQRLGWDFFDADDYHPPENVAKMQRGVGLADVDRAPWLDAVRSLVELRLADHRSAVIACSALKRSYRARLQGGDSQVVFVWLDPDREVLERRLAQRKGHFAGPDLLQSQFDALEPPSSLEAVCVEADGAVDVVADRVMSALGLRRV